MTDSQQDDRPAKAAPRRRGQALACGWCGSSVRIPARGRVPKWCSPACRHRAWEQKRAAESGLAAIEVVDRVVEVDKLVPSVERVEVPTKLTGSAWSPALVALASQIDSGRVYDRDLPDLAHALAEILQALERRPAWRQRRR